MLNLLLERMIDSLIDSMVGSASRFWGRSKSQKWVHSKSHYWEYYRFRNDTNIRYISIYNVSNKFFIKWTWVS